VHHLLAALLPHLPACRPADLANAMWAATALKVPPPAAWMQQALQVAGQRATTFSCDELAALLVAAARVRYQPAPPVLRQLLAALSDKLPSCGVQALANTLWALACLRATLPSREWLQVGWLRREHYVVPQGRREGAV
jgi:hypothetical protein